MARVTVEDCIDKVENRFDLVLLAGHRARQLSNGAELTIDRDRDKNPVVALREIGDETLSPADLKEDLIHSLQKQVEVDEPEADMPDTGEQEAVEAAPLSPAMSEAIPSNDPEIPFDQMSEDDLLASIEGLVPPEKNDDY